jgi:hypothetical protein
MLPFAAVGRSASIAKTELVSSVTAPFSAKSLPVVLALVFMVMLASAIMLPRKMVDVPIVAELPTFQKTFLPRPPLTILTSELLAVVSVLPIWKTKFAVGLPPSLRKSVVVT